MLEVQHITKIYNPGTVHETCLFRDFSLQIAQGSFVSVVGSNGSGKTSLLNILCGSIPVESGSILMDGVDITKVKEFRRYRRMGRVYQNPAMGTCPTMTILENLSMADNKGRPTTWALVPTSGVSRRIRICWRPWAWAWRISWVFRWVRFPGDSGRRWHCSWLP